LNINLFSETDQGNTGSTDDLGSTDNSGGSNATGGPEGTEPCSHHMQSTPFKPYEIDGGSCAKCGNNFTESEELSYCTKCFYTAHIDCANPESGYITTDESDWESTDDGLYETYNSLNDKDDENNSKK